MKFDLWRAGFYLLAIVILIEMLISLMFATACTWAIVLERAAPFGSCQGVGEWVRQIWAEALAAVLALLLAARGNGKEPPSGG